MPMPGGFEAAASIVDTGINMLNNQIARSDSEDFIREMWWRNNEYNKPINQVARAREAGLNPYAMLQQGGFNAGNSEQADSVAPAYADYSPGMDFVNSMTQSSLASLQDANTRKVSAEADRQLIANRYAVSREIQEINSRLSEQKLNDEERANLEKRKELLQKDLDSYDQRLEASLNTQREQANLAKEQSFTEEMKRRSLAAGIRLSNQQIAVLSEEAKKVKEEVEQMKLNGISQRQINRYIASREQETARKLHIENEKLSRLIGVRIENIESETQRNRREHRTSTFKFMGIPLGTEEKIDTYNSDGTKSWSPQW